LVPREFKALGAATGRCRQTFADHTGPVLAVAFAPDRKHLVSAGCDQAVRIWDLP